jgi:hypothetical protein
MPQRHRTAHPRFTGPSEPNPLRSLVDAAQRDPDPDAFLVFLKMYPAEVQDAVRRYLREYCAANPEFLLNAVREIRRVARDPSARRAERRTAQRFLERHGYDDATLANED